VGENKNSIRYSQMVNDKNECLFCTHADPLPGELHFASGVKHTGGGAPGQMKGTEDNVAPILTHRTVTTRRSVTALFLNIPLITGPPRPGGPVSPPISDEGLI